MADVQNSSDFPMAFPNILQIVSQGKNVDFLEKKVQEKFISYEEHLQQEQQASLTEIDGFVLLLDEEATTKLRSFINAHIFTEEIYRLNDKVYLCKPVKKDVVKKKFSTEELKGIFTDPNAREFFVTQILQMPKWKDGVMLNQEVMQNLRDIVLLILNSKGDRYNLIS